MANAIVSVKIDLDLPAGVVADIVRRSGGDVSAEKAIEAAVLDDTQRYLEHAVGDPDVEVAL